jgi:hypothetical protein
MTRSDREGWHSRNSSLQVCSKKPRHFRRGFDISTSQFHYGFTARKNVFELVVGTVS